MSIRALYIFSPNAVKKKKDPVIYSRCFPTVERRARILHGDNYQVLPGVHEVCDNIFSEIQVLRSSEFIDEIDSCKAVRNIPVYRLRASENLIAVAIRKNALVICAVPFIKDLEDIKGEINFSRLVCLSIIYTVIHSVADVIGDHIPSDEGWNEKIVEVQQYISICMPFGTPLETNPSNVKGILASRNQTLPKMKMPAWRPFAPKGKQTIQFSLQENIRAVQHGKGHIDDVCEIYGTINCRVDLEGAPEISLNLIAPLQSAAIDQVVYHPCVLLSDDPTSTVTGIDKDVDTPFAIKPVRFCPPLEAFSLCHYKAKLGGNPLPLHAYYQMKMEETVAKILVQVKLADTMQNSFEFCNVHIPFFNKGTVKNFNCIPLSSNVSVSQDRTSVVWTIGQKFPKSLEVSLEGTIEFNKCPPSGGILKDPFCFGMNSFLQISFKVADFTVSGLRIDSRSLMLLPRAKVKTSTISELVSTDYRVWNSHGDTIYAPKPNLL